MAKLGAAAAPEQDAALFSPLAAVFVGDEVAVLDRAAPWIRMFGSDGKFRRSLVPLGSGPGEAEDAFGLAATEGGGLLLSRANGATRLEDNGAYLPPSSQMDLEVRHRGAVEACGGSVFYLAERTQQDPRFLVEVSPSGKSDTIARLGPPRPNSRNQHGWFVHVESGGFVMYPEEADSARLLRVDCNLRSVRDIAIDQLGSAETYEFSDGQVEVFSPKPPLPAGIGRVDSYLLWAVQAERSTGRGVDSVTIVTAIDDVGIRRNVALKGWFQLLDSNEGGSLLFGNWWGFNRTQGAYPIVFVVDGHALLSTVR